MAIIGIAERRGVLSAAARRDNGYREHTDDDLCQLRLVVSLRSLGLDVTTRAIRFNESAFSTRVDNRHRHRALRRWSDRSRGR
jgi:DNA-binding transcriptional MerR regulator